MISSQITDYVDDLKPILNVCPLQHDIAQAQDVHSDRPDVCVQFRASKQLLQLFKLAQVAGYDIEIKLKRKRAA